LPGRLDTRSLGVQPGRLQERDDLAVEDGIAIQDDVAMRTYVRKGLAQLLHDPLSRRVPGSVEVQDVAASVRDDEEAVQNAEGRRRHGEEVERDNRLTVVANKREPAFGWIAPALNAPQISRDGRLG
jgi:hypothetical protein